MHRYVRWGFALAALPLAACADNPAPSAPTAPAPPPPLAAADSAFMTAAAQGGLAELQAAQLAQTMARDPKVKSYAAKLTSDHTQANAQLKQLASTKNVTLPTAPNDMEAQQITALQSLKGHRFDHEYVADQIADHQQMLQAFQAEAQGGTDPDVKAFAAAAVPTLQSHLDMANALNARHAAHRAAHHHTAS